MIACSPRAMDSRSPQTPMRLQYSDSSRLMDDFDGDDAFLQLSSMLDSHSAGPTPQRARNDSKFGFFSWHGKFNSGFNFFVPVPQGRPVHM